MAARGRARVAGTTRRCSAKSSSEEGDETHFRLGYEGARAAFAPRSFFVGVRLCRTARGPHWSLRHLAWRFVTFTFVVLSLFSALLVPTMEYHLHRRWRRRYELRPVRSISC